MYSLGQFRALWDADFQIYGSSGASKVLQIARGEDLWKQPATLLPGPDDQLFVSTHPLTGSPMHIPNCLVPVSMHLRIINR